MATRFSKPQIILHWLTLLMVILTYSAMLLKDNLEDEALDLIKNLHFNFGLSVFVLMFIRLGLRSRYPVPPITPALEQLQALAANVFHWLLYLLFLSLPILGFLTVIYGGREWVLLGWQVPQLITPDPAVRSLLKDIHETLANTGYAIIAVHTSAALFHHYLRRDDTLRRMMPGK